MKRYLITGAAGFIGSVVADKLLASGAEVVGLDNLNNAEAIRAFTSLMHEHNYSYVPGPEVGGQRDPAERQNELRERLAKLSTLRGSAKEQYKAKLYRDYEDMYPGDRSFG